MLRQVSATQQGCLERLQLGECEQLDDINDLKLYRPVLYECFTNLYNAFSL